jgi:uncharacterized membrane protein YedE/YeeE
MDRFPLSIRYLEYDIQLGFILQILVLGNFVVIVIQGLLAFGMDYAHVFRFDLLFGSLGDLLLQITNGVVRSTLDKVHLIQSADTKVPNERQ